MRRAKPPAESRGTLRRSRAETKPPWPTRKKKARRLSKIRSAGPVDAEPPKPEAAETEESGTIENAGSPAHNQSETAGDGRTYGRIGAVPQAEEDSFIYEKDPNQRAGAGAGSQGSRNTGAAPRTGRRREEDALQLDRRRRGHQAAPLLRTRGPGFASASEPNTRGRRARNGLPRAAEQAARLERTT